MKGIGNRRGGFTLIEVLLVIVILAALATVAVVTLWPAREEAKIGLTQTRIQKVMGALERYATKLNGYPTEDQGLKALVEKPGSFDPPELEKEWTSPFAESDEIKDEWKHELKYKLEDVTTGDRTRKVPRVWSMGPNGTDDSGEGDDIKDKNWANASAATGS